MKTLSALRKIAAFLPMLAAFLLFTPLAAHAHCDTMNGPVVQDARKALETTDVTPVLKWIPAADEAEVKSAFERTVRVRASGGEVGEMADLYFFETVVRLHRMGEGVGYTGLKPALAVEPAVAAADAALATGSVEALADLLAGQLRTALAERFAQAHAALAHADHNVEAGRAYVEAYVRFTHLAEEVAATMAHAADSHAGHGAAGAAHVH